MILGARLVDPATGGEEVLALLAPVVHREASFPIVSRARACSWSNASRAARSLGKLLPQIAMGSAVVYVEADTDPGGRIFNTVTAAALAMPERGGRVLFALTESLIAPATIEPRFRWDEVRARLSVSTLDLSPGYDLHLFRYVLVHSRTPFLAMVATKALAPEARRVDGDGEWTLLESNLPLVPIDSPQPRPPEPPPAHLRTRLVQVLRRAQTEGIGAP